MIIKILGSGCAKCRKLEANARQAVADLGIEASFEKVQDMEDILAYNVNRTPALVVDDKVILSGKVASAKAITKKLA